MQTLRERETLIGSLRTQKGSRRLVRRGREGCELSAHDICPHLSVSFLVGAAGPVNETCCFYTQLDDSMLVFRGLVTNLGCNLDSSETKHSDRVIIERAGGFLE